MKVEVSQSILQIRQLLTVATAANWERAWLADCRRRPCHSLLPLATSIPALTNYASLDKTLATLCTRMIHVKDFLPAMSWSMS